MATDPPTRQAPTATGNVVHLHRIRNALRVLLIPAGDPTRANDPTWLRQADTALHTLAAHHRSLPAMPRAPLAVLVDSDAAYPDRHQALLEAAELLRVQIDDGHPDPAGPVADVIRHPAQQGTPAQGQLFDPSPAAPARPFPEDIAP